MDSLAEFDKCPAFDRDLNEWAKLYPEIKDVFFGDNRTCETVVSFLANLKMVPVGDVSNVVPEYELEEDEIETITNSYKDDTWNTENISEVIRSSRETANKENSYINNIIRDWKDYEVPAVEKGYYRIGAPGIFRIAESINEETGEKQFVTKDVCRTPFIICGISEPLKGNSLYFKIRYLMYSGEIKEFWESQSTLLSRKELKTVFLAKGINCPENNLLMETIDYISRCIAEFSPRLKKEFSAKQNGWNADKSIFVLGDRAISSKGIEPILSVGDGKGFPELEKKGTLEGWVNGTRGILGYDLIRFKCYDALTAPLKSILGVESHATDHYGNTSCGKTFSSQVALSIIGDAEELTIGAKSTAKGILVHIRDFSDLPILIDESSDAGDHLADLVYPLTSNKGRVKSTVDGQRDGGEEFHTSTMFTGERPIRDCLPNSGQQYRVNELDDTLPDLPTKEINAVKTAIREHHGHVIELYLKKVIEWRESGHLQSTYDSCFDVLPENTSNIEGRSRAIFACIMTAGTLLESVFNDIGMPGKKAVKIVKTYFKKCIQDKPVELEYIRALRVIIDWVHSDCGRFAEINQLYPDDGPKIGDRNKRYGYVDEEYIDIIGTEFTKKMKDEGFSPSKIKEDFWQQGIADGKDTTRKGTTRFTREGKTIVGVRIFRRVAEELAGVSYKELEDEDIPQNEKIKLIMETVKFLTMVKGKAELNLIRVITEIQDLDDLLSILSTYGKIQKISQTAYKNV